MVDLYEFLGSCKLLSNFVHLLVGDGIIFVLHAKYRLLIFNSTFICYLFCSKPVTTKGVVTAPVLESFLGLFFDLRQGEICLLECAVSDFYTHLLRSYYIICSCTFCKLIESIHPSSLVVAGVCKGLNACEIF